MMIPPHRLALLLSLSPALPGITLAASSPEAAQISVLEPIVVTGTRERQARSHTAQTSDRLDDTDIDSLHPAHPAELLNRIPGVHINALTGEGHMSAIRQPITSQAVYLFLEDGIPTRSTGFFNHNALYEVNLPQAGAIEVSKGPGTALYGSDAIGGVINAITRPPPSQGEVTLNLEGGAHGWRRTLLSGGDTWGEHGLRADLNLTHSDGWREHTAYARQSATLRWDKAIDTHQQLRSVLTGSHIDQPQTGALPRQDYENNPRLNNTPIGFRQVQALRFSSHYEHESADTLFSMTPYLRRNSLDLMPTWQLSYDPQVWRIENDSLGLLLKWRGDFTPLQSRLILGIDVDHSPGTHQETQIITQKDGNVYTNYQRGETQYDYDVTFQGLSPYLHYEAVPSDTLRLSAGLRYDALAYEYENHLSVVDTGAHRRPASTELSFHHLSPKLGLVYTVSKTLNGFLSYRHAFRAPSEGQLFRQGKAQNTVDLKPVEANSIELGLRARPSTQLSYELSLYYMPKKNDILSFTHNDGTRETLNAGETLHRGIEIALHTTLHEQLNLDLAASYAKHSYRQWQPKAGIDYAGHEIKQAPRLITNTRLRYQPSWLNGGQLELEWEKLGPYWEDDENTHRYKGHDLVHLRADYLLGDDARLYARLMNLSDARYATSAAYTLARGEELTPGLPRSLYLGLDYTF